MRGQLGSSRRTPVRYTDPAISTRNTTAAARQWTRPGASTVTQPPESSSSGRIVSLHSFRGGTGKSNVVASLAYLKAAAGKRVAVLDTDLQSPGIHVPFGLEDERVIHTLSDFCLGLCKIEEAAYDLTAPLDLESSAGRLFLLPSSMKLDHISKLIAEGYDASELNAKIRELIDVLELDYLLIDTHPGLNRETMMTLPIADRVLLMCRPDSQDLHGAEVVFEVAKRLRVPRVELLANKVPEDRREEFEAELVERFDVDVIGVLPLSEDVSRLGSRGIFSRLFPSHPVTDELRRIASSLQAERGHD
ncbi:MAG: MinD/ParA family protein [Planctomycetes bacterium]|nr:MinD/ParA family protein [Planctomycetota bacterium]